MAYNSYKEDEKSVEKSKLQTLKRLLSYLLKIQVDNSVSFDAYGILCSCKFNKPSNN